MTWPFVSRRKHAKLVRRYAELAGCKITFGALQADPNGQPYTVTILGPMTLENLMLVGKFGGYSTAAWDETATHVLIDGMTFYEPIRPHMTVTTP